MRWTTPEFNNSVVACGVATSLSLYISLTHTQGEALELLENPTPLLVHRRFLRPNAICMFSFLSRATDERFPRKQRKIGKKRMR